MSTTTNSSRLPNYRIYDRTGGGVTEDIYASSLEDAIQQGRDWIEAGDWNSSDDGVYRTITLECCVREIVRYRSEPLPGESIDEDGDLIDEEGYLIHTAADMGEIDAAATDAGESYDCSGTFADELPECEADPEGEASTAEERDEAGHVWVSPHSLVGGLKENPGCWSGNGTTHISKEVCKICGCYKTETDKGSQCHESEARVIIEIEDRDADSEAWLKRVHEEDGWLPQWLADYLECPPTVRMTEEEAKEWVEEHTDEDELDAEDLEHAFAAIFGRRADDQDRQEGLWSHLTA